MHAFTSHEIKTSVLVFRTSSTHEDGWLENAQATWRSWASYVNDPLVVFAYYDPLMVCVSKMHTGCRVVILASWVVNIRGLLFTTVHSWHLVLRQTSRQFQVVGRMGDPVTHSGVFDPGNLICIKLRVKNQD